MQDFQQRVIDEQEALEDNITKLSNFLLTSPLWSDLPEAEKMRLIRQLGIMEEYSEVLQQRIEAFV